jgi:hypothetical protein
MLFKLVQILFVLMALEVVAMRQFSLDVIELAAAVAELRHSVQRDYMLDLTVQTIFQVITVRRIEQLKG